MILRKYSDSPVYQEQIKDLNGDVKNNLIRIISIGLKMVEFDVEQRIINSSDDEFLKDINKNMKNEEMEQVNEQQREGHQDDLQLHLEKVKNRASPGTRKVHWKCDFCDRVFPTYKEAYEHEKVCEKRGVL